MPRRQVKSYAAFKVRVTVPSAEDMRPEIAVVLPETARATETRKDQWASQGAPERILMSKEILRLFSVLAN